MARGAFDEEFRQLRGLRQLFESESPQVYEGKIRDLMGLTVDANGFPCIRDAKLKPEQFSLRGLMESFCPELYSVMRQYTGLPDHFSLQAAMEDASAAIQPSAFANISGFNATTGLMLEVRILESYRRPQFIANQLCTTIPTGVTSQKVIGPSMLGDWVQTMNPGDPHPRAQFGERYVTTPHTQKRGLAIEVLFEDVFFDRTGEVLKRADDVGEAMAMRKEYMIIDVLIGLVNPYVYKGTGYNTYLTSGNWINKVSGIQLLDWTSLRTVWMLFTKMTDQETGQPIDVDPVDILVTPFRWLDLGRVTGATQVTQVDNQANPVTQRTENAGNVLNNLQGVFTGQRLQSKYLYKRLTDANGLNQSPTNAQDYFFTGDFKKALAWMQNWDVRIRRADASNYEMMDKDIIFSVFADEMGIPTVTEPRAIAMVYNAAG